MRDSEDTIKKHFEETSCEKKEIADLTEDEIKVILGNAGKSGAKYITQKSELDSINADLAKLTVTKADYDALCDTDKVFVTIYAHTIVTGIKLDKSIVEESMDAIGKMVKDFFKTGTLKGAKVYLQNTFNKYLSTNGSLFYGVKMKKSDFSSCEDDVRKFLALFLTGAKQGKDTTYDWTLRSDNINYVSNALTTLMGVVLSSRLDKWTTTASDNADSNK
jgi:hypothetical protein